MNRMFLLAVLFFLSNRSFAQESIEKIITEFQKDRVNGKTFTDLQEFENNIIGKSIPDFCSKTITGDSICFNSFKGKIVVINFWFIGCHPCIAEMPGLNKIVSAYKDQNIIFLAITWESVQSIKKDFLTSHSLDFTILPDAQKSIDRIMPLGYPTTYIIDQNGILKAIWFGGSTGEKAPEEFFQHTDRELKKLLNKD